MIGPKLDDYKHLRQWQRYAAYCLSCARCGEKDPLVFDVFIKTDTVWTKEGKFHGTSGNSSTTR